MTVYWLYQLLINGSAWTSCQELDDKSKNYIDKKKMMITVITFNIIVIDIVMVL